ncbi:MAG: YfhO family protein [Chloroflexi bacterium]|nr:YfhO family protein [Chloroflexota bacterium]
MKSLRQHQTLLLTLLFFTLALLFMSRVLFPDAGQAMGGHDTRALFYPWLRFTRAALVNGRLPLWDASQFAGYPFLSNPQIALFYPPTWLALLPPVHIGLSWHVVFHLTTAALGMYLFVRQMSGSKRGALLAALAFGFSGFAAARIWAGHIGLLATDAWLPWLLLATVWAVRRRDVWSAMVAGVPLALAILAGHTTSLLYIGLIWGLFGLYLAITMHEWEMVVRQLLIAGVMSLLLSAVQLLPLAEFAATSTRTSEATLEFATQFSLPPAHLITLLIPAFFGEPVQTGYWSVPSFDELTYYVGVLALIGLLLTVRRPSRLALFYLILITLGLLLAFGSYGFLYEIFYRFVPGFQLARAPARAAFLYVFAASALLGEGVAIWERGNGRAQLSQLMRWLLAVVIVAGTAALAATATIFAAQHPSNSSGRYWHQMGGWGLAILLLVVGGVLLWKYLEIGDLADASNLQSLISNLLLLALALLVITDLWLFGWKLVRSESMDPHPLWTDAKTILGEADGRVLPWGISIFEQNGAGQVGLDTVFGYNALEVGANTAFASSIPDPRSSAYDVLGVRYVLAQTPLEQYTEGERPLTILDRSDNVLVYERARVLPIARLVSSYEVIPEAKAATARVHQPDFDLATSVILEREPDCELGTADVAGTAVIAAKSDGYWQIETNSPVPTLLVLSETAYPGWQALVDGEEVNWLRAYTAVRAVCVPAGNHLVEWHYQPTVYWMGGVLSLLGLGLVLVAIWRMRSARRVTDDDETAVTIPLPK